MPKTAVEIDAVAFVQGDWGLPLNLSHLPGMAKRVEDTEIPIAISTTDFYAASEVTIEASDLETAVAASIAIPGLISAPTLNGRI